MPTSRSPRRSAEHPPAAQPDGSRFVRPFILIVALAVLTVIVVALPASIVKRFLPRSVSADDFSGSLWHGSAGRVIVDSHDAGAIEWHLHPWSLLSLTLAADVHWVKMGLLADAGIDLDRRGLTARAIRGGGPIDDLSDFGVAAGWHGTTEFDFREVKIAFAQGTAPGTQITVLSAVGELSVSDLTSAQIADGLDLGGYVLHFTDGAITPDVDATAELNDTGGPIELAAVIHFSAQEHTGMLAGTVRERTGAPPALRIQLDELAELHARDAQGRIPVELEFTL